MAIRAFVAIAALIAILILAQNGRSSFAADDILELPVSFSVTNSNTSGMQVRCAGDNQVYVVRGHILGPRAALESNGPKTITHYIHGFDTGWHFKFPVDGYDWGVELAKLGHISLMVDMLGYDTSGHPPGNLMCLGTQADVSHQIIQQLRNGLYSKEGGTSNGIVFSKVLLAGHDIAGGMAEIEAYSYKDIDGLIVMTWSDGELNFVYLSDLVVKANQICGSGGEHYETGAPGGQYMYFGPQPNERFKDELFYDGDPAVMDAVVALRNRNPCGYLGSINPTIAVDQARTSEITVPVFLLYTDQDPVVPDEGAEPHRQQFINSPDVSTQVQPNSGHFPWFEKNAGEYRARVSNWLCSRGFVSEGGSCRDFAVDSTADAVDATPGDGACASGAGECTLRAAVQETNALPGPDAISVPAGVYNLTIAGSGEDAAVTGDLDITDDVTITGAGAAIAIVDANRLDRVFHIPTAGVNASISGMTMTNGSSLVNGGGILNLGTLTVADSIVTANATASLSGGIANSAGATLTVSNSTISGNTSAGAGGIGNLGTATVINSTISGNSTSSEGGGLAGAGTWTVTGTLITGNQAGGLGGGIAVPPSGTIHVSDSTITGNLGTGGGGLAIAGSLTLTDSTISGNTSRTTGGGLGHLGPNGTVSHSLITGNSAAADGGGIANGAGVLTATDSTIGGNSAGGGGGIFNSGTMSLSGSVVSGNTANQASGIGGGILNSAGGSVVLTDSFVRDNSSWLGGGIGNPSPGAVTVIRSQITGNRAVGFRPLPPPAPGLGLGAGGIGSAGQLTVVDSTISGNMVSVGNSGGIGTFGTAVITGSTISDNFGAAAAGGIGNGGGTMVIRNSTVSGNTTNQDGGGIAFAGGMLSLNNVTITNNVADVDGDGTGGGGGIFGRSPATLANTILAGNVDTGGEAPDCSATLVSQGFSLIGSVAGCTYVAGTGDITGQSANLGSLADNGGPTQTHALLAGSPAIDAGNPATPGSTDNACDPQDQRGVFRPQDGNGDMIARCDIGAFEVGVFTSTLGKVTGGGSIASSSGSGEASFGFVVKAVSAPSGSRQAISGALTYIDHSADVKIGGVRFDQLTIDGSHAVFTGTADVNGTAKRIRVTVDDPGEPGRSDTFEIEVLDGSYANGPKTLSGGNIQVHK